MLLRLTAIMCCVCGLAVTATRVFALPSDSPLQRWLRRSDGSDCEIRCLFGIAPGRVSFERAVGLAERHPTFKDARLQRFTQEGNFGHIAAVFRAAAYRLAISEETGGGVRYVLFDAPTIGRQARLADLIVVLGSPASLQFGRSPYSYVLYYPQHRIEIRLILWEDHAISPNDVVSGIYIQADRLPLSAEMQPWRGLVSLRRYQW